MQRRTRNENLERRDESEMPAPRRSGRYDRPRPFPKRRFPSPDWRQPMDPVVVDAARWEHLTMMLSLKIATRRLQS